MIHGRPVQPDVLGVIKVDELVSCKLGVIVNDNVIRDPGPLDDVLDKLHRALRLEVGDGSDLDPLGKLVDGNQEVIKSPMSLLEFVDHVEALDYKGLGVQDGLECLCR